MDFKSFLSGEKTVKKDYYWSLVLEPGWVQAGIWSVADGKADVSSVSPATPWEEEADLIGAVDTALSAASQNLPEDAEEPSKTVFGVPPSWVKDGQIKSEYLNKIKKICVDLSLQPAGFVVLPEAIAHLAKSEEGAPLNAIVLGVGQESIELVVFRLGNLVGTTNIARSVSVADDVVEGLTRFSSPEPLPSRFLVYDGKGGELEEVRQSLLSNDWAGNEKIKFLHTPKVEIIGPERKVIATSLAGASELTNITTISSSTRKEQTFAETETENLSKEEIENIKEPESQVSPEEFGFVVGEDVAKTRELAQETKSQVSLPQENVPGQSSEKPKINVRSFIPTKLTQGLKINFPKSNISQSKARNLLIIGGVILVLLFGGGFAFWWFYPKAAVTIYISPKSLDQNVALIVDSKGGSTDVSKSLLAGEIIQTEVNGEKSQPTSGTKLVGDKAKGTVKIQNGTANVINLVAGTALASTNNLKFTLGSSASVSAALSPSAPGEATVDVSASDIGAEYNLANGEIFKIGNYPKSEVDAIATLDFSGGSSRQISAVSADDQKTLENDLTNELTDQAKGDLGTKVPADKYLIESSISGTATSKNFSAKVGDEATNLKLDMSIAVTGIVVQKADLFDVAKNTLQTRVPSGYVLRNDQVSIQFNLKDSKNGIYNFDLSLIANLLPEINTDEISGKIRGRKSSIAESYFATIPGFGHAEINYNSRIVNAFGTLPNVAKNISIEVAAER